jgi:hypothetical protein
MNREEANVYSRNLASALVFTGKCIFSNLILSGTDAAATAGTIQIYDGVDDTGTLVYQEAVAAAAYTSKNILFNITMTTGIYIKITTTNDVQAIIAHKTF